MQDLLLYLIQVNILLGIVFIGYYLLLRNLTFYKLNRVYFLTASIYAFIYPLLHIRLWFTRTIEVDMPQSWAYLPENFFQEAAASVPSISLQHIVLAVIFCGVTTLLLLFVIQLLSLFRVHRNSILAQWKHYIYRNVNYPIVPFSFFNKIYLHRAQYEEPELYDIFEHENIHVRGLHSIDIIWFEIVWIVCWFNPLVWLMRKAVRQNLEFLTDQQVLRKGADRQTYQYSLLHATQRGAAVHMGNKFNFKSLKKRIMMMNKKRSSQMELSKYAFLLPIIILIGASFTVHQTEKKIENMVEKSRQTSIITEAWTDKTVPELDGANTPRMDSFGLDSNTQQQYNAEYPLTGPEFDKEELRSKNFHFKIDDNLVSLDEFHQFPRSDIYAVDIYKDKSDIYNKIGEENSTGLFVITSRDWASQNLPLEKLQSIVQQGNIRGLTFSGNTKDVKTIDIVESKADYEALKKNFPSKQQTNNSPDTKAFLSPIDGVSRLKNRSEIDRSKDYYYEYDEKAISKADFFALGDDEIFDILLIGDRQAFEALHPTSKGTDGVVRAYSSEMHEQRKKISELALLVLDGEAISKNDLHTIHPDNIASINVLKDKSATAKYGDKGKYGAIEISSKSSAADHHNSATTRPNHVVVVGKKGSRASVQSLVDSLKGNAPRLQIRGVPSIENGVQPLITVDGKKMPQGFDLNTVDANTIESITILKEKKAVEVYGNEGKAGVITVKTKSTVSTDTKDSLQRN